MARPKHTPCSFDEMQHFTVRIVTGSTEFSFPVVAYSFAGAVDSAIRKFRLLDKRSKIRIAGATLSRK